MSKKLIQAAAGAGGESVYVEDVFSTYLYEGNGSTSQSISNGIDLAGEGGLVWIKERSAGGGSHRLLSTDSDGNHSGLLDSSSTAAAGTGYQPTYFTQNSDGFTTTNTVGDTKVSGNDYASWTFRKQAGFFDVVTYTGDGVDNRQIAHNLGSVPGMIIVKSTSSSGQWPVYHQSLGTGAVRLNLTNAYNSANIWWKTTPTDTHFTVYGGGEVNVSGIEYVAYLFAHDDQRFGDGSDESIIKCGSYTGNGSTDGPEVDLGFEPQWVLIKNADIVQNWYIIDNMRGMAVDVTDGDATLLPNTSGSENTGNIISPLANGFKITASNSQYNGSGNTIIYIAIRRPMKTPEAGTDVFAAETIGATNGGSLPSYVSGFPVDMLIQAKRDVDNNMLLTRLLGETRLFTNLTNAESAESDADFDYQDGAFSNTSVDTNRLGYMFKRATGFFDVVTYTGDGVARNITHNLGVVPELLIFKTRSNAVGWAVSCGEAGYTNGARLELNSQFNSEPNRVTGTPTSTTVPIGTDAYVNVSGRTYVAYLFATLDGVSKVGSYSGTGSAIDVDCGFSAGARFVLIKRTDSTGDWYVWDSERGIVAGNDPYLLLNSTAAEVTSTDYIDPLSSGFTVTSSAPAALNTSGGTYIFLAIS